MTGLLNWMRSKDVGNVSPVLERPVRVVNNVTKAAPYMQGFVEAVDSIDVRAEELLSEIRAEKKSLAHSRICSSK